MWAFVAVVMTANVFVPFTGWRGSMHPPREGLQYVKTNMNPMTYGWLTTGRGVLQYLYQCDTVHHEFNVQTGLLVGCRPCESAPHRRSNMYAHHVYRAQVTPRRLRKAVAAL